MGVRLFDNLDDTVVVLLSFYNRCVSSSCQFLVKLIFFFRQIEPSVRSKVLFILRDQIFKILQCLTVLNSAGNVLSHNFYLTPHSCKKILNLLHHVGFHVFRVDLSNIAKAILICFVFFVEFPLQITGN